MCTTDNFRYFILTISLLALVGCKEIKVEWMTARTIGREVTLPTSFDLLNERHIADTAWLNWDNKIKLVVCIPREDCTGCRLGATGLVDSLLYILPASDFAPIVIIHPIDEIMGSVSAAIERHSLKFPIYLDKDNLMGQYNSFLPKESMYHSFLLDKENRIVLVGDPSTDYRIMQLYKSIMTNINNEKVFD